MDRQEFFEMLEKVLEGGVEISIRKDKDTGITWYDMNTEMKSHLYLAYVDDKCVFDARYDRKGEIKSYDDLLDEVSNCMHGRDFGNKNWLNVLDTRYDEPIVNKKHKI